MKHKESLDPWEALFSSATRPQPIISLSDDVHGEDDVDAKKVSSCDATPSTTDNNTIRHRYMNNKGGYTILIQYYITPKSQRKWALSSTMSNINIMNSRNINRVGTSSDNIAPYGISGPLVMQHALEELCLKCNGAVIFVSTLGMNSLDMSGLDPELESYNINMNSIDDDGEDDNNMQMLQKKRRNAIQIFQRHGACVDLSSDPFGWELDDGNSPEDIAEDTCKNGLSTSEIPTYSCSMDKLQSIAMTTRRAAASIESRRSQGQIEEGNETNLHQPIPIVFESMTPLLNRHGVEKVGVLLKSLDSVNSFTATATTAMDSYSILSPIVAPVLYESIRPSDHRYLEDISDAMLHVSLAGEGSSYPSGSSSATSTSSFTTVISSGVLDLVRRGGSRGLGGKFIRHCIPFHIMRLTTSTAATTIAYGQLLQSSYYWILDHVDQNIGTDNTTVTDNKKKKVASDNSSKSIIKSEEVKEESSASRPRIYMQDDDPEYDDYDEEEDLDDDLDL